jgi:hypothetical protein
MVNALKTFQLVWPLVRQIKQNAFHVVLEQYCKMANVLEQLIAKHHQLNAQTAYMDLH